MRISVLPGDPGYLSDACDYRVFVDNEIVHDVITVDDVEGFVLRYACAPHDVMPNMPTHPTRSATERINAKGRITIQKPGLQYARGR